MNSTCLSRSICLVSCLLIGAGSPAWAQSSRPLDGSRAVGVARAASWLEGWVLDADGRPVGEARVASSAGGQATTAATGHYRFQVSLTGSARDVEVSVRGLRGSARRTVTVVPSGTTWVEPLALRGGSCTPTWLPTFGGQPGIGSLAYAVAEFDDGTGNALYVGGFEAASGGVPTAGIGRWDGARWSALGAGVNDLVRALAVFDDGSGPALYAGGEFTEAGGAPASFIARWDGTSWSPLGLGTAAPVWALAVWDDGSGPALYVAGEFSSAGGGPANRVARWDGSTWSALGSGLGAPCRALAVYDGGSGSELYVGGTFVAAGGVAANRIARWNGKSWSPVGSGVDRGFTAAAVNALAVHDPGSGPRLYVGGRFDHAGGLSANNLASWNGSAWTGPGGGGLDDDVLALASAGAEGLLVGGDFDHAGGLTVTSNARWLGTGGWAIGAELSPNARVRALGAFDLGDGPQVFMAGDFTTVNGSPRSNVAGWFADPLDLPGASLALGGGGLNGAANALALHDDGTGMALYAGGEFRFAGEVAVPGVARRDGSSWSMVGDGQTNGTTLALASFDDGSGPALYATGTFSVIGGASAYRVARWDGSTWAAVGGGLPLGSTGQALVVHDDGGGPALYAGGSFGIRRWDGTSWSDVGGGELHVYALTVFDDGSSAALYVGGAMTQAGGVPVGGIARWDGTSWSPVGTGIVPTIGPPGGPTGRNIRALAIFDDGGGPALYAGGSFDAIDGAPANGVARWDGTGWSALGQGLEGSLPFNLYPCEVLAAHDDGNGSALYAGGFFESAGGIAARGIARWDGTSWSPLGTGLTGTSVPDVSGRARSMIVYDDGNGPALVVGGLFAGSESHDSFLARWGCDTTPPVIECPPVVRAFEALGSAPGEVVNFTIPVHDDVDPEPTVVAVPPSGSFFPFGTTMVLVTASDSEGNESTCSFPVVVELKAKRHDF